MDRNRRMTNNEHEYDALLHERAFAMMDYRLAFKHKLELDGSKWVSTDDRWRPLNEEEKTQTHGGRL